MKAIIENEIVDIKNSDKSCNYNVNWIRISWKD